MDGRKRKFILELQKKSRLRRESGLYVIDGPKMAKEVPSEIVEEICVTKEFMSSVHMAECSQLLKEAGFTVISESEMRQISDTVSPQGILIVARQNRIRGLKELLSSGGTPLLLILETIQDPGNLGTILRASEAAGVTGVIMDRETVDVYSPKVVRSTMGAILRVPFLCVEDLVKAAVTLKEGSIPGQPPVTLYAAHLLGAADYTEVSYRGPSAVMIGNESKGLSDTLASLADRRILIPMCGHVESLNAAMAAAVISFEAARQRRGTGILTEKQEL